MPDPAAAIRFMYLATCEACARVGIPAPTPDEWVDRLEEMIRDAQASQRPVPFSPT